MTYFLLCCIVVVIGKKIIQKRLKVWQKVQNFSFQSDSAAVGQCPSWSQPDVVFARMCSKPDEFTWMHEIQICPEWQIVEWMKSKLTKLNCHQKNNEWRFTDKEIRNFCKKHSKLLLVLEMLNLSFTNGVWALLEILIWADLNSSQYCKHNMITDFKRTDCTNNREQVSCKTIERTPVS